MRERKKRCRFGGWGSGEELGEAEGVKTIIRI